jgi:hypothetical protein
MVEKRVMAEVKYPFNRAELLELGEELARATDELREIDRKKKEVAADIAAEQKRADGHVSALAGKIKDKFEYREVECVVIYGAPRAGLKTVRPVDSRLEEHTESMTADELQAGLDFGSSVDGSAEAPPQ